MTHEESANGARAATGSGIARFVRHLASVPAYPVILVVAHVLTQTSQFGVPYMAAFRPLVVCAIAMIGAQALLMAILGRDRGSFVAATIVTFVVGAIFSCLALLVVAVARTLLRLVRASVAPDWSSMTRGLNVLAAALVTVTFVDAWAAETFVVAAEPAETGAASEDAPNMYLLMLDGYPRSDTLESWGFDNAPFLTRLEALGFEISPESHSNYMKTWVSLASMADLRHVNAATFGGPIPSTSVQHRRLSTLFNEGRAWTILREHGYEIVSTDSAFADLNLYRTDRLIGGTPLNAFETDLLRLSPVSRIGLVSDWIVDAYRQRVKDQLEAVMDVSSDRPMFVWSHVLSPHAPAIFDRDGGAVGHPCYPLGCSFFQPDATAMGLTEATVEQLLIEQVQYVNGLVEEAVQAIAARDPTAVIVILSDHGARHMDPNDEFFRNFFAARTPGHAGLFPPDAGMVTTMAVLLNAYLEAGVSVPDGDAVFMSESSPLDLVEWAGR